MKKVFLTGAALLAFAAAGFAQTNTATTNQNGDKQTSRQTQTGNYLKSTVTQDKQGGANIGSFGATLQTSTGAAGNEATIEQNLNSVSNRASVTQSGGTGNKGTITQNNLSGDGSIQVTDATSAAAVKAAGGNWAGILQQGSNNTNTYVNQGNSAYSNFGEIYQYGSSNRQTSIDQSNNSSRNKATVNQGTAGSRVTADYAEVAQQGDSHDNTAAVTQLNSGNVAFVKQSDNSTSNATTIKQSGGQGYESAYVYQGLNADHNTATVTQGGFGDFAYVYQQQNSSRNEATIEQRSTSGGYGNVAGIYQEFDAVKNQATVRQDGINNNANVNQFKVTNSKATITQDLTTTSGGNNTAEIQQGSTFLAASERNTATITQEYSNNVARVRQYGNDNTALFSQEKGDNNLIKGVGTGTTASNYALQQGDNNYMKITQDSGASGPYVANTASASQIGNSNSAIISQTGRN